MTSAVNGSLVIKGSRTGLGDRIRAVLVGLLYAELANRRVYVDWRDGMYGPPGENVFERFFTVRRIPWAAPSQFNEDDVAPAAWKGRLAKSMDQVYVEDGARVWNRQEAVEKYSVDLGRMDYPQTTVVSWEFTQLSRLKDSLPAEVRNLPNEALERWAWHRYLRLAPDLTGEVDELFKGVSGTTVGVHIRASLEFIQQKGHIDLGRYFSVLDRLSNRHKVERILVATDNEDVLRAVKSRYPQAMSRPKWFTAPGEPLHLFANCPDSRMMARDALIEMAMLARCDWLISVDNSSYSVVARLLSEAPACRRITLSASKRRFWERALRRAQRLWRGGLSAAS